MNDCISLKNINSSFFVLKKKLFFSFFLQNTKLLLCGRKWRLRLLYDNRQRPY